MRLYDKFALTISVLSLSVSIFVAVKQFQPVQDNLIVEASLGFSNEKPLKELYRGKSNKTMYGNSNLAGPFVLEITLSNNLSRSVSVKNTSINIKEDNHWKVFTPAITYEDTKSLSKIVKIEGNGVERVSYQVNLPIYINEKIQTCLNENEDNKVFNVAIEKCYYEKSIDIFGNKIRHLKHDGSRFVIYQGEQTFPSVEIFLTTGDGTRIKRTAKFSGIFPASLPTQKNIM